MTEDRVIQWMSEHGHHGYANEIHALQDKIKQYEAAIAEVKQAALDRYEDWRSDPLP